jgi:hypothetical protein
MVKLTIINITLSKKRKLPIVKKNWFLVNKSQQKVKKVKFFDFLLTFVD